VLWGVVELGGTRIVVRGAWCVRALAAAALIGLACGAEDGAGDEPAAQAEGANAAVTVHIVRMVETDDARYVYDPVELTIRQGDRVRWINVSGGPHNVEFYQDRIPAGAKDALNAAMPERMGDADLVGKLLFDPDERYEISFAGVPPGTYEYVCTPHAMVGMTATIIVTR
jgi:plastocyanin